MRYCFSYYLGVHTYMITTLYTNKPHGYSYATVLAPNLNQLWGKKCPYRPFKGLGSNIIPSTKPLGTVSGGQKGSQSLGQLCSTTLDRVSQLNTAP